MDAIAVSFRVENPSWQEVYCITRGQQLEKGRHGLYWPIVTAAGRVSEQFGCYAWGSRDAISYIGSFSKDYQRGNHGSNLAARVHNYLQNHRLEQNGHKNTNLMVFEKINEALASHDVILYLLRFEFVELGGMKTAFAHYSADGQLVAALEQVLICSYKKAGQCSWNRS